MKLEKPSRQKYYKMWLLSGLSNVFAAVRQYATIVRQLPRLRQNHYVQLWYDSFKNASDRNVSLYMNAESI